MKKIKEIATNFFILCTLCITMYFFLQKVCTAGSDLKNIWTNDENINPYIYYKYVSNEGDVRHRQLEPENHLISFDFVGLSEHVLFVKHKKNTIEFLSLGFDLLVSLIVCLFIACIKGVIFSLAPTTIFALLVIPGYSLLKLLSKVLT